ncbi:FAD-binding oxidoreductase [Alteriqipengyuania lutimaris]|uniref:FAD-binding oxidoreductase n=1 Tax=Alteriqipengyuania lutimaris TaxID=1538146 RepID=A0A395LL32_9SPHN|nr:FAD-binding oxidoreductase [Alteriqipengyuania lutimaris]MBB3035221.1 FAD/FMN-containing dehydrogenase [Alteriqipengyuania lutimaris]RDS76124.1 FAD-binding oxidoreductase [Alteriqipengyuania lutimaris]
MSDGFLEAASDLLGPRGLTRDAQVIEPWLTDWRGRYHGNALALASPANTREVAQLVKLCAQHRVPIVPQGGNSGMSGGATPDDTGRSILLSLRRMDAFRGWDEDARQVVCDAGVVLQTLHEEADKRGLRFPLTLGGKGSATIGGLVSTNAGGTQVLRHGTMRAQVRGLEAVLPDGTVLDTLAALKKDNRGFDLKQVLIGSEGTLGIVTAATLRLLPRIAARRVLFVGLASVQQARRLLLLAARQMGDALEGFEIMPRDALDAVLAYEPTARDPLEARHDWYALLELVADEAQAGELEGRATTLLESALEKALVEDATIAANETQAEALWALRDGISSAERAHGPAVQHDISVPPEAMPDFIEQASTKLEKSFAGTRAVAFGHLGDGNVHFHLRAPEGAQGGEWENADGKAISAAVHDLVTQWGGSISAEHGIGQMKREELARLADPAALTILRGVKQALDPLGIMNPGKLVPLASQRPAA